MSNSGAAVDDSLWQPYFNRLIQKVKEAEKDHEVVVLTFAVVGVGKDGKKWLSSQGVDFKFIHIDAPKDMLVKRFIERTEGMMKGMGMTLE